MTKFSVTPLYLQVRDSLAERIAAQAWKANTALPNETDLAKEMDVSPGTMRKALDLLEVEGLVTRKQGRGTYVNDFTSPSMVSRYSNFRSTSGERVIGNIEVLNCFEGNADYMECKQLQLKTDARVYQIQRRRSYMGKSFMFETVSLPAALFPGLSERGLESSGLTKIASAYGILLGSAAETVAAGAPSAAAQRALHIIGTSPILALDRVISARDGTPLQWRIAECRKTDDLKYIVET